MNLRKLKFKGTTEGGAIVYGTGCYQSKTGQQFVIDGFKFIPVVAVMHLRCYDKDGREGYEWDRIIEPDGKEGWFHSMS